MQVRKTLSNPSRQKHMALAAIAAIGALAAGTAAAAPDYTVNVYGKIDAFAEYDSGGSQGRRLAFDSGGFNGSRWGLKGDLKLDTLSPDLKAIYQLEGGLFINNGRQAQSSRLFGRQAYAGLTGNFGTLTFGRQYTPLMNTLATFDAFGQGYGSPLNDGQVSYGLDSRYDNALIYATPNMSGFNAAAMFAAGGQTGGTSHNAVSLSLGYANGPFGAGVAFQRDDHDLAVSSKLENVFAGASYKVGPVNILGGVQQVKLTPDAAAEQRRHEWMLGAQIDVTASGQLWLDYGTGKTTDSSPSDKSQAMSAAWMEQLTKQARVYVVGSVHKNDPGAGLVPMGTNSSGAYPISPGNTAHRLAVGFQYNF